MPVLNNEMLNMIQAIPLAAKKTKVHKPNFVVSRYLMLLSF